MAHFRDLCTKHMEISFLQKRDKTLVVWSFLGVEISKVFVHGGGGVTILFPQFLRESRVTFWGHRQWLSIVAKSCLLVSESH